jgi:phenylalanine-4-hydroxylase
MDTFVPNPPAPGLRGDYAAAGADYLVRQGRYAPEDHATWRTLYAAQSALLPGHAAQAFREGLARLDCAAGVPEFDRLSATLRAVTGWSVVAVPGLIPEAPFFAHLAARRFPAAVWMRRPEELDYLVEPDLFHDVFGHVPLLTEPRFARFLEAYGRIAAAAPEAARKPLSRLHWHMVEFGLIREEGAVRAYGAGILSSRTETLHATTGHRAHRLRFDPWRVLRSDYFIDDLQPTYFVIEDFAELYAAMEVLPALLPDAAAAPPIPPGAAAPGDEPI